MRAEHAKAIVLPQPLNAELDRLHGLGFDLLPLGGGKDGKAPRCRSWRDRPLPLTEVKASLAWSGAQAFGIRLKGMVVLDCDEQDPALVDRLEARFGLAMVKVSTPRGLHLYYTLPEGQELPKLKREGLAVDVKSGFNAYVVGAGSIRSDGGIYQPLVGRIGDTDLTPLRLAEPSPRLRRQSRDRVIADAADDPTPLVKVGNRHVHLVAVARSLVPSLDSKEALIARLVDECDRSCAAPETFPLAELNGIATWTWELRMKGHLYGGAESCFAVHRAALTKIADLEKPSDAIALLTILQANHGHVPGKTFALCHSRMTDAYLPDLSTRRFRAARDGLCELGLLVRVGGYCPGKRHQQFRLAAGEA